MAKEKIITGIDVGSTKISTTVAAVSDNKVSVIGVSGNVVSKGIKKGNVIDIDAAVEAISSSLERAERMAGVSVSSAFVSINGSHIETLNSHGVVAVSPTQSSEISQEDVVRVIEAAQAVSLPSTREVIHVIPRDFIVDSQEGIKDPIGMSGVRLEVETNIIHGSSTAMKNLIKCVSQVGVGVEDLVYTGIAAAEAVLTDTEKELGTLLVDIGGGTTSMIAFIDGSPVHSAVLPIGGKLITSDLAIGLRTRLEDAEKIKLKLSNEASMFKSGDVTGRKNDDFDLSEFGVETDTVSRSLLYKIVDSRLEEIFRLIALELSKVNLSGKLPAGVVVTGGGASTSGVERVAKMTLKLPVRIGTPRGITGLIDEIQGPTSSVSVGTVLYGVNTMRTGRMLSFDSGRGNMNKAFTKIFDRIKSFLP
ncbi:cell division protein FtsA [candidate division WWE3 bacterium RIFOXYC1_FULL_39_7]|uniref:Cell division protein FtsA n=1 Tax=candidate division WWE3 bacterium RIFOXYC1_FULL_39_7 TaxID=1802643 RepID=A0A1F4WK04_UNCKA|nr:MAG: cell division protein FtsA [candidate division WWE3 bacterium RIFOXYC1_FULL_39_7]